MGKWVKCSERLPQHMKHVQIRYRNAPRLSSEGVAWRDASRDAWFCHCGYEIAEPHEWYDDAPPEPPKQEIDQVAIDRYWLIEVVQTLNCALAPEATPAFVLRRVRQVHRWLRDALDSEDYVGGPRCPGWTVRGR